MITAQARNLELGPHIPMLPLAMDAALLQFRRLVAQAVEAEQGLRPLAPPPTGDTPCSGS